MGQFVYVIRRRIKLSAEKAIFIFVDNVLPPTGKILVKLVTFHCQILLQICYCNLCCCMVLVGAIMSAIYEEKKDEDGFLYVTYSGENTFGYNIPL